MAYVDGVDVVWCRLGHVALCVQDGTYSVQYVINTPPGAYVLDVSDASSGQRIKPTPSVIQVCARVEARSRDLTGDDARR
jgi:hypothetical protein